MKRDMDLIRELLLRIEAQHIGAGSTLLLAYNRPPLIADGENIDEIAYAMRMMEDAGFLDLVLNQPAMGVGVRGLSWSGHDFLDSVRDPQIWQETKEVAGKAGGFTVDLLVELAKGLIKTQIKKHTGVEL
jgi:hypothetical protein